MINQSDLEAWDYWGESPSIPESAYEDMRLMGMTPLDMVREFARAFGHPLNKPYEWGDDLYNLRKKLIQEEFNEVNDAVDAEDLLKELADSVYVIYGMAATYGWDLDEAVRRVHVSNMSKLGDDGKPVYREDGKVLKGPNYQKPYLKDLV